MPLIASYVQARAFRFPIERPFSKAHIALKDHDDGVDDDDIGRITLCLGDLLDGVVYDAWFPLQYQDWRFHAWSRGRLRLRYSATFASVDARKRSYQLTHTPFTVPLLHERDSPLLRFVHAGVLPRASGSWTVVRSRLLEIFGGNHPSRGGRTLLPPANIRSNASHRIPHRSLLPPPSIALCPRPSAPSQHCSRRPVPSIDLTPWLRAGSRRLLRFTVRDLTDIIFWRSPGKALAALLGWQRLVTWPQLTPCLLLLLPVYVLLRSLARRRQSRRAAIHTLPLLLFSSLLTNDKWAKRLSTYFPSYFPPPSVHDRTFVARPQPELAASRPEAHSTANAIAIGNAPSRVSCAASSCGEGDTTTASSRISSANHQHHAPEEDVDSESDEEGAQMLFDKAFVLDAVGSLERLSWHHIFAMWGFAVHGEVLSAYTEARDHVYDEVSDEVRQRFGEKLPPEIDNLYGQDTETFATDMLRHAVRFLGWKKLGGVLRPDLILLKTLEVCTSFVAYCMRFVRDLLYWRDPVFNAVLVEGLVVAAIAAALVPWAYLVPALLRLWGLLLLGPHMYVVGRLIELRSKRGKELDRTYEASDAPARRQMLQSYRERIELAFARRMEAVIAFNGRRSEALALRAEALASRDVGYRLVLPSEHLSHSVYHDRPDAGKSWAYQAPPQWAYANTMQGMTASAPAGTAIAAPPAAARARRRLVWSQLSSSLCEAYEALRLVLWKYLLADEAFQSALRDLEKELPWPCAALLGVVSALDGALDVSAETANDSFAAVTASSSLRAPSPPSQAYHAAAASWRGLKALRARSGRQ